MKKIVSLILVAIMILSFGGCGENNNSPTSETTAATVENKKENEYLAAETAYNELIEAHELCIDVMDGVYSAWYFSIYKHDDYYGSTGFSNFCREVGVNSTELLNAISDYMGSSINESSAYILLDDFSYSTYFVGLVFENNGTFEKIDSHLNTAKNSLKSVTNEYSDYTGYSVLKSYYSEIKAYGEFCKSPTGSFSQLKTTIDNYETNLRNYKNDLSFIFE